MRRADLLSLFSGTHWVSADNKSGGLDGASRWSRGVRLMLIGGVLLLTDTLAPWQKWVTYHPLPNQGLSEIYQTESVNAWNGFCGVVMCVTLVALLAWLALWLVVTLKVSLLFSEMLFVTGFAGVLAAIVLVTAAIKNVSEDHSTAESYVGILFAAVIAVGAWLAVNAAFSNWSAAAEHPGNDLERL